MRRLIPILVLSALTLLASVAALASLRDSVRIAYYSQPPAGTASNIRAFHRAIESTLHASSFLYDAEENVGKTQYQAPDRTRHLSSFEASIVIGQRSYVALSTGRVVSQWGEGPLTPRLDEIFGPLSVTNTLREIEKIHSIVRERGEFIARQVIDANEISPETPGQALIVWVVETRGQFISSVAATAYGLFQTYFVIAPDGSRPAPVKSISLGTSTYSEINRVPEISAPPRSQLVRLVPCKNRDETVYGSGGYVCGTLGT